jgi:hypothetical protein
VVALAVTVAFASAVTGRYATSAGALSAGALLKFSPLAGVAPLLAMAGARLRILSFAAVPLIAAYALLLAAGYRPWGSVALFLEHWRFSSPVFVILEPALGADATRLVALAGGAALIIASYRAGRHERLAEGFVLALLAPIVAAPAAFPWYLVVPAAFLPLCPSATLVLWAAAAPLTYEVIDAYAVTGAWSPAPWAGLVVAAAVVSGAIIDVARVLHRRFSVPRAAERRTISVSGWKRDHTPQ